MSLEANIPCKNSEVESGMKINHHSLLSTGGIIFDKWKQHTFKLTTTTVAAALFLHFEGMFLGCCFVDDKSLS